MHYFFFGASAFLFWNTMSKESLICSCRANDLSKEKKTINPSQKFLHLVLSGIDIEVWHPDMFQAERKLWKFCLKEIRIPKYRDAHYASVKIDRKHIYRQTKVFLMNWVVERKHKQARIFLYFLFLWKCQAKMASERNSFTVELFLPLQQWVWETMLVINT